MMNTATSTPLSRALIIDPINGSVCIHGCTLVIAADLPKATAAAGLSQFYHRNTDHKNGYEWLMFRGVTFGGQPAGFSLCFYLSKLTEVSFGASLPNAKSEGGWPTREAIDEEVAFVHEELRCQLMRPFQSGPERFPWGVAWAEFDAKGFTPARGFDMSHRAPRSCRLQRNAAGVKLHHVAAGGDNGFPGGNVYESRSIL
jgi:hypothetical protein